MGIGVGSIPLIGLIGQYGYHPNYGCDLLKCDVSMFRARVPFYSIYILGLGVPCVATMVTSILIFKQLFCYCILKTTCFPRSHQNFNIKNHLIFAVFIILYTCCSLVIICLEMFYLPFANSSQDFILFWLLVTLWYTSSLYIRLSIVLSPKSKEMMFYLFRDLKSKFDHSQAQSIILSNLDCKNNLSNCRV